MVAKMLIFILAAFLFTTDAPKNIVFFGDSLTAGYGVPANAAFPALIDKKLAENKKRCNIMNAGVSGETTAGGLARIDWILKKPVDIFILELGANDGLRGLPLTQTERNLQMIIDRVKKQYPKAKIVVVGMMVPPNLGKEYADQFKNIFPKLAKKNSAVLIPFLLQDVAGQENLNIDDGIHPNAEGHKIIARNIIKFIEPLL
jgi:acyl-CoA thioesterase I